MGGGGMSNANLGMGSGKPKDMVRAKHVDPEAEEIDYGLIKTHISSITESIKRFSDIITKAKTINSNSRIIQEAAESMENDIRSYLNTIAQLIR